MEIGSDQIVVKPDRYPDLVTAWGGCFWWPEMVFMNRDNELFAIKLEEDTGKLRSFGKDGVPNRYFPDYMKQYYDKWWYETFESHFLGEESDV